MSISEQLRHLRKSHGFTLEEMAKRCGLSKGYLSRVENGQQTPAVSTIQVLAAALNSDIADLLDAVSNSQADGLDMKFAGDLRELETFEGYSFQPLLNSYRNKHMSPFLLEIATGETKKFSHDSEEYFYVAEGAVEFIYKGKTYSLSRGDSVYFDSREKHFFRNPHKKKAVLVTVNYNYRRF